MKTIPAFKKIEKKEMIDCRVTSLRNIFHVHGVSVNSAQLFLMLDVIDFRFGTLWVKENSKLPLWVSGASCDKMEEHALKNLKAPWKQLEIGPDAKIKDFGKYVKERRPILYSVDSSYVLNKQRAKQIMEDTVKMSNLSLVTVIGYDKRRKLLQLDLKEKDFVEVSLEMFQKARYSRCFPESANGRCYEVNMDAEYLEWFWTQRNHLVVEGILKTCRKMLDSRSVKRAGTDETEYAEGLDGMLFLVRTMEELRDAVSGLDVEDAIASKVLTLEVSTLRNMLLPGSDTCYREEFGSSLCFFAAECQNAEVQKLGERFVELGAAWRGLIRSLSAVKYHMEDKVAYLESLIEKVKYLYEQEKQGYLLLESAMLTIRERWL